MVQVTDFNCSVEKHIREEPSLISAGKTLASAGKALISAGNEMIPAEKSLISVGN